MHRFETEAPPSDGADRIERLPGTEREHLNAERVSTAAANFLRRLRSLARLSGYPPERTREEGDRQSQHAIGALLSQLHPADPVLSEEAVDDPRRLSAQRVWIVDPLDGTREFAEMDRSDWAIHVALAVDGVPVVGAVALPALDELFSTRTPPPLPSPSAGRLRILVSRSRPPAFAGTLAGMLDADLVEMGSAGAKTMAVLKGEADAYVHDGGQYEWDSAAPVAVARAAGLHASRLDGSALCYNQPRPWLPDQLVCLPSLAGRMLEAL